MALYSKVKTAQKIGKSVEKHGDIPAIAAELPKKEADAQNLGSGELYCSKIEQSSFDEIVSNTVALWHGYRPTPQ